MATITANTSSIQGEYLDVLDPNTWVGGVVPGPNDIAVFPNRIFSYYRTTWSNTPGHEYYHHPPLGPWSGSNGTSFPDGQTVDIRMDSTINLGLDEVYLSDSGSVYMTLSPLHEPTHLVKIDYKSKASTVFYSCSIDQSYTNWIQGNVLERAEGDNRAIGRMYYNANYFVRNMNQYQLTGNWEVGHIDVKAFTEFKLTGSAYLTLVSTTVGDPMIDWKNNAGNYTILSVLDESTIEISGSQTETSIFNGLYQYNNSHNHLRISGSANYSSSFTSESISVGASSIRISDPTAFAPGDVVSIQSTGSFKYHLDISSSVINYNRPTSIGVYETGSYIVGDLTDTGTPTHDVMHDELVRIVTMSNDIATVSKYHSRKGYVQQDLGPYSYNGFVESFTTPVDYFQGNKKAILVNSTHKGYKKGDNLIIGNKAYTIDATSTYLSQSLFYDFTDAAEPADAFVWSPNEMSGSGYSSQTTTVSNFYWWDEIYRKGTLWGSGSIKGTPRSYHINSSSLKSYGPTPYNVTKYDTYAYCFHYVSRSFFDEGEIEVSASVTDNLLNEYDNESGIDITWPKSPFSRMGNIASLTIGHKEVNPSDYYPQEYGFKPNYGCFLRSPVNRDIGRVLPFSEPDNFQTVTNFDDSVERFNELAPPCNATASGESFSLKWTRDGHHNQFYYRDKGGETQMFESYTYEDSGGVGIGIQDWAKIYSISIKQRYQVLLLNTTDSFSVDDKIRDGGTLYSHEANKPMKWIATAVKDEMGYKNLLWDWYEKRGQTSILPYIQGNTYTNADYNYSSNSQYITPGWNSQDIFSHRQHGGGSYFSWCWANAGHNMTFDLGTPVTFDTIGVVHVGGGQFEGTSGPQKLGANNYMKSVEFQYSTNHSTDTSTYETIRATADDTRNSTGLTGIRYYTLESGSVTAQVIKYANAGGSEGTAYTDIAFFGVYSGLSGSNSCSIELENVNNYKVGDHIFLSSHLEMPDFHFNPAAGTSIQNHIKPSDITNYNVGSDADTDISTNGGLRQTYEIMSISGSVIGLDRRPVYGHITKGTLAYKANRGNVRLKVNNRGKEYGGFNIYTYGNNNNFKIHNTWMDGSAYLNLATLWGGTFDIQDSTFTPPYTANQTIYEVASTALLRNTLEIGTSTNASNNYINKSSTKYFNRFINNVGIGSIIYDTSGLSLQGNFNTVFANRGNGWPGYRNSVGNYDLYEGKIKLDNSFFESHHAQDTYWDNNIYNYNSNLWGKGVNYSNSYYWNVGSAQVGGLTYVDPKVSADIYSKNLFAFEQLYDYKPRLPRGLYGGIAGSANAGSGQSLKYGVLNKKHVWMNDQDMIMVGYRGVGVPQFGIINKNDHFTLWGIQGGGNVSTIYITLQHLKYCSFKANEDCDINIQFDMDYIWSAEHLLSYGKSYGLTGGPARQNKYINTLVYDEGIPRLVFAETLEDGSQSITKDKVTLNSNSRTYTPANYNKTFSVKKGHLYRFFLNIPLQSKYYFDNWKIGDYKNVSFNIFMNDLSNLTFSFSNFDIEKKFKETELNVVNFQGNIGGSRNMGSTTVGRITNNIGSKIKINKVKL